MNFWYQYHSVFWDVMEGESLFPVNTSCILCNTMQVATSSKVLFIWLIPVVPTVGVQQQW